MTKKKPPADANGRGEKQQQRRSRSRQPGSIQAYDTDQGKRWRFQIYVLKDPEYPEMGSRRLTRSGFTSTDEANDASMICGGALGDATGSVFATSEIAPSSSVLPETGSKRRNSFAVTTRARSSIPNASPSGGLDKENVCFAPESSSMTVRAFFAAAAKFPK